MSSALVVFGASVFEYERVSHIWDFLLYERVIFENVHYNYAVLKCNGSIQFYNNLDGQPEITIYVGDATKSDYKCAARMGRRRSARF